MKPLFEIYEQYDSRGNASIYKSIASDAQSTYGWVTDLYDFSLDISKSFQREPLILKQLAPKTRGVNVRNAKFKQKSFVFNKVGKPKYATEAHQFDRKIDGQNLDIELPEIFMSFTYTERKWEQLFGGQSREGTFLVEARDEFKDLEEVIGFQGSAGTDDDAEADVTGLVSTGTTDLGAPAGKWDVDTNNNGVLDSVNTDIRTGTTTAASNSFKTQPIHTVWTGYCDELVAGYAMPYKQGNNKVQVESMLRGGRIFVTDNVQADVTADLNTMVMLVDLPTAERGWGLITSGLQIRMIPVVEKFMQLLREIFSIEIKRPTSIMWMNEIDTTT